MLRRRGMVTADFLALFLILGSVYRFYIAVPCQIEYLPLHSSFTEVYSCFKFKTITKSHAIPILSVRAENQCWKINTSKCSIGSFLGCT